MSETTSPLLVGLAALLLAAVHASAGRLRLRTIPRSYWLSGAGGVSVAYVFVHILPELQASRRALEASAVGFLEHHVYLLALAGFGFFYGVERFAREATGPTRANDSNDEAGSDASEVFWLHVGTFAVYNALVGYLLFHREESGVASLVLFTVAMALHFVVNDHGLRDHHRSAYDRVGRWVLSAGVLAGAGVGGVTVVEEAAVSALFALLAGGIILNVIKEELPTERKSRFSAFAVGAVVYTALLLVA